MVISRLTVPAILLVLVVGSGVALPLLINTENATYEVEVDPVELGSNDQIRIEFTVENTGSQSLEGYLITSVWIAGVNHDAGLTYLSVPPQSTETFTHETSSVTSDSQSATLQINVFENGGANTGLTETLRPAVPRPTAGYLAAGTLLVFSCFSLLVLGVERLGRRTWVHENPFKTLLGVLASTAIGLQNERIWSLFGFLNDSPTATIFLSVLGVLAISIYVVQFIVAPDVPEQSEPIS